MGLNLNLGSPVSILIGEPKKKKGKRVLLGNLGISTKGTVDSHQFRLGAPAGKLHNRKP